MNSLEKVAVIPQYLRRVKTLDSAKRHFVLTIKYFLRLHFNNKLRFGSNHCQYFKNI